LKNRINTSSYLIIIILLAVFLRLYKLDFQSLWGDELYSLIPTHPANSLESVIEYSKSDQPPLYFILLNTWFKLVPYNEYTGRLLSVVFGVIGVVAMYFLGKEFKDEQTGLLASIITALNYFHIYYSQEMRFYSLLFLMSALSYLFFLKCYKKPKLINYFFYCLFSIGLVYTHYFGPVVIITQAVIFLILVFTGKNNKRFIIFSVISGLVILFAYLPWLPTILKDTEINAFWIEKPYPLMFGMFFYRYLGKDPFLALIFIIFIGLFIRQFIARNNISINSIEPAGFVRDRFIILSVWIVISYLIPYLYSVAVVSIMEVRYTIIMLPAFFVIFSLGLSLIKNARIRAMLIGAIFISTTLNFLFFNKYYTRYTKDRIRDAANATIANYQKPTKVFSTAAYFYNYYFDKTGSGIVSVNPTTWYPGQSDTEADFETELANEQQVWILGIGAITSVNDQQQAYLNEHFVPSKTFKFLGADAILYTRK
jgi:uncharacterized membrane protein